MMYLLFFGKSQSFTWEAFDESGHCPEFNQQFPGFESLDSKLMTIDRRDNAPVWARYRIKNKDGRPFSLLKVYAFAQAYDGSRISGSSYGVALVSDRDIQWHPTNIDILEAARLNFSKLVLNHQKFSKTNFLPEAQAVWQGMVGFSKGNLLDKVVQKPIKAFPSQKLLSAAFPNVKTSSPILEQISAPYERFYVSSDADHLARIQEKWGSDRFPIYQQGQTPKKASEPVAFSNNHTKVKALLEHTQEEIQKEDQGQTSISKAMIIMSIMAVMGWAAAIYLYLQPAPPVTDPKSVLREWQLNTLGQASKRDTLAILLQNLKWMETDSSRIYPQAIRRDAQVLQLDSLTLETLLDTEP